jgi:hypothetical protein
VLHNGQHLHCAQAGFLLRAHTVSVHIQHLVVQALQQLVLQGSSLQRVAAGLCLLPPWPACSSAHGCGMQTDLQDGAVTGWNNLCTRQNSQAFGPSVVRPQTHLMSWPLPQMP